MPAFDILTAECRTPPGRVHDARVRVPDHARRRFPRADGRVYITANAVRSRRDRPRLEIFQQRASHYYENWDRLYANCARGWTR